MADHEMVLHAVGDFTDITFECLHAPDNRRWFSTTETGKVESERCWFASWWDALGVEMLDLRDLDTVTWPVAVRPSEDWTFDDGGKIVVDR